tara:strand:- start:203 stop:418 length:216 start_codon:yes stop_codon:yes gene_type:complete
MQIVQKKNTAEVRVEPIEYDGIRRIDVRLWVWAAEQSKMIPTKRGVSLKADEVDSFIEDVREAKTALLQAA